MAHDEEKNKSINIFTGANEFAEIFAYRIGKVLDQALEENIGNKLDYIGDQLKDIKESMQKIAANLKEVGGK